jgi:hypothetical protein
LPCIASFPYCIRQRGCFPAFGLKNVIHLVFKMHYDILLASSNSWNELVCSRVAQDLAIPFKNHYLQMVYDILEVEDTSFSRV